MFFFFSCPEQQNNEWQKENQIFKIFCINLSVITKPPDTKNMFQRVSPDTPTQNCPKQHHTYIKCQEEMSPEPATCPEIPNPCPDHRTGSLFTSKHINTHDKHSQQKGCTCCLIKYRQYICNDLYNIFHNFHLIPFICRNPFAEKVMPLSVHNKKYTAA